jgi:hypothetical protein
VKRRRRRREFEPLGTVLGRDKVVRTILPPGIAPAPIGARDWELAVGTRIATRTRPEKLERGTLWVITASAAWSQELSLLVDPIKERLANVGVEVKELRFRVGKIEMDTRIALRRPPKEAPREVRIEEPLARALANVGDDELRRAIAAAAKRALGFGPGKPEKRADGQPSSRRRER